MSITLINSDASIVRVSLSEAMRCMDVKGDASGIKAIDEDYFPEICNAAVPRQKRTIRSHIKNFRENYIIY